MGLSPQRSAHGIHLMINYDLSQKDLISCTCDAATELPLACAQLLRSDSCSYVSSTSLTCTCRYAVLLYAFQAQQPHKRFHGYTDKKYRAA